ncbi:MAG: response regulator [Candidatus Wallbacteria bacterium]|nr:response regulator [Candidatus Wallbacteria bacterium]
MPKILVVEDSETQATELKIILEAAGHAIELAGDGREGLSAFRGQRFDLVVSDVLMPHVSGYELCRTIKDESPGLPVILLTGLDDPANVLRGYEAGANGFIVKPYEPDHLVTRIHDVLSPLWAIRERISSFLLSAFEDLGRVMEAKHLAEVREMNARSTLQLHASEERFRCAFEENPVGMAMTHPEGRFVRVNPVLCQILGHSREALLERGWTDVTHPGECERIAAYLARSRSEPRPGKLESRFIAGDGRHVLAELTVTRMHDAEGTYTGDLWMLEDTTERRKVEDLYRQSQKMEAVGRLASGVAHDFNNVLTAIIGYSNLILGAMPPDNTFRPDTEAILRAAQRAAGLTKQLLGFSRPQGMVVRSVDLNAIVLDVKEMLARLLGADVELETQLSKPLGPVRADPDLLTQVIVNLAVNARDAMPSGGKLVVETRDVAFDDWYAGGHPPAKAGPYVVLEVSDTGAGMSADTLSHMFEPFFTTKEKGKGTGLGLATVYGIVRQCGGHIDVWSEPGKGASFRVYLPRGSECEVAVRPAPRPQAVLQTGDETVLVVDDEAPVRSLAARILRRAGYTVLEASDGEAALETLGSHKGPLHLLLSDFAPSELARKVREASDGEVPQV